MLNLRLTVAATIQMLTFFYFFDLIRLTYRGWLIGTISLILSASMVTGFLTPIVGALIFLGGILLIIFESKEINSCFSIYLTVLSLMSILLGPGPYSLDAKLFGRREIKN